MNPVDQQPFPSTHPWLRFLIPLFLILLCLTQMGCDLPQMPWDKKSAEKPAEEAAPAEEEEEKPVEKLDMSKLIPPAMRNLPFADVTIPMSDGLQLKGRLYDPAMTKDEDGETVMPVDSENDYTGPKYPLVVLLHGLNLNQSHWGDLPATLMKAGYAVLALDLRGHGQSTKASRGRIIGWRSLEDNEWPVLYRDIGKTIEFFGHSDDYPEVNGKQVALIGEKLGANVAIWAAKQNSEVKAMALLTPGMTIKGIDAGKGIMDYPNSTMILASQDIADSFSTAKYLYTWLGGPKVLQVYEKAGEGADMLTAQPSIAIQLKDWLIQALPPAKIPGAALSDEELKKAEWVGEQATKAPHAESTPAKG